MYFCTLRKNPAAVCTDFLKWTNKYDCWGCENAFLCFFISLPSLLETIRCVTKLYYCKYCNFSFLFLLEFKHFVHSQTRWLILLIVLRWIVREFKWHHSSGQCILTLVIFRFCFGRRKILSDVTPLLCLISQTVLGW